MLPPHRPAPPRAAFALSAGGGIALLAIASLQLACTAGGGEACTSCNSDLGAGGTVGKDGGIDAGPGTAGGGGAPAGASGNSGGAGSIGQAGRGGTTGAAGVSGSAGAAALGGRGGGGTTGGAGSAG